MQLTAQKLDRLPGISCLATMAICTPQLICTWTFQEPQAQISCPHQSYATSPNYFSSPHSPGASLGEDTTGMSSRVAQHQPTDSRSSTAMKSSPPQRRTQPFPPRQEAQCRLDGSGWVPSLGAKLATFFHAVLTGRLGSLDKGFVYPEEHSTVLHIQWVLLNVQAYQATASLG